MGRIEYGYGSGYINGKLDYQKIGFSTDGSQPTIAGINILVADQATGVERDRFAGIIGLAPRSTEVRLPSFISQMSLASSQAQLVEQEGQAPPLSSLFSFYLGRTQKDQGMVTFGGYDVPRFAKEGLTDKDVFWANIEKDEKMWTVNLESIGFS